MLLTLGNTYPKTYYTGVMRAKMKTNRCEETTSVIMNTSATNVKSYLDFEKA